jgi:hypothetical protein
MIQCQKKEGEREGAIGLCLRETERKEGYERACEREGEDAKRLIERREEKRREKRGEKRREKRRREKRREKTVDGESARHRQCVYAKGS